MPLINVFVAVCPSDPVVVVPVWWFEIARSYLNEARVKHLVKKVSLFKQLWFSKIFVIKYFCIEIGIFINFYFNIWRQVKNAIYLG